MSTFQKIGMGVILVAFVTTLVLPGRQTPALFTGLTNLSTGTIKSATGQQG